MVETLTAGGADANSATMNGTTALMFAAQAGNADAVKALLAQGADVNAKEKVKGETRGDDRGCVSARADVIRVLTAKGADLRRSRPRSMDLAAFNKEEQERLATQFQQQQAARPRRTRRRAEPPRRRTRLQPEREAGHRSPA